ncbi:MAG: VCBS repeat-containing protein [Acidobacteriota bacterium]|nr:MAG: VCBS repeat-containing protein [Acidobacteriota bacterium]
MKQIAQRWCLFIKGERIWGVYKKLLKGKMRAIFLTLAAGVVSFSLTTVPIRAGGAKSALPFGVPWVGYNVGSSAYTGNPAPFERDPTALVTADFNGDGAPDVAVSNYEFASPGGGTDGTSGFVVILNDGNGAYGTPTHYTVSNKGCWDIAVGDFDGDGDIDIVVPVADTFWETGNTVVLFLNDGTGAFPNKRTFTVGGAAPTGITVADFDGDGHLDVATSNFQNFQTGGSVSVLRGDGTGHFASHVTYPVGDRPFKLAAGDLNGDGRPELAVAHNWQQVSVLINNGTGGFGAPLVYDQIFPWHDAMYYGSIALGDSDNDGDLDIFYSNTDSKPVGSEVPRIAHLRNNGGTFSRAPDIILNIYSSGPSDLAVADFDGDGWLDVAGLNFDGRATDGLRVVYNNGAGGFGPSTMIPAGQGTFALAVADVDSDGSLDLLSADRYSMAVTVHKNPGDGQFPVHSPRYPSGTGTTLHLVAGDVDGDGDLDLFASGEAFGTPGALIRNNGDGTFADPVIYTHSTAYGRGVSNAKLRDLNGDGHLDLLYNDAHTDSVTGYDFWVGLNDGTGTFGPLTEWDLNTCGNGDIDAIDLDNDGDLDVVNLEQLGCAGGNDPQHIFIRLNNGDATFQPAYTINIGRIPRDLGHGDFNDDGNVDLVTAHWGINGANDFINVHLGNGDGTFQEAVVYNVGRGPRYVVVADFNGDGHADFATANSSSGNSGRETLTVIFGVGDGTFTGRSDYYAPYSPDLQGVQGLEVGDVDGDGDFDLMMATVAGGIAMYYNDGAGNFTFPHRLGVYWGPWSPVFADFDGDAVPDLAMLVSMPPSGIGREIAILSVDRPPTAAVVDVSGRVMTPDGRGLRNATVSMTGSDGVTRVAITSSFGYYRFEDLPVGDSYEMSVKSRSYRFVPRTVVVKDTLTDVDFVGLE